jgi:hypothetical protein
MMSAWFSNPLYLIGAAGVLLPVLIHLLTRERVQRVDFPTLRFFVRTARATLARKRLWEVLLIALRMLVCLLLVLTFANPLFARRAAPDGKSITARVVAVDVSGSMNRPAMEQPLREALGQLARQADQGGARTAVLAFDAVPRVEADFEAGPEEVRGALQDLRPGQGGSNLDAALRKANEMLATEKTARKEIVLVSDLQKTGWARYRGDWRLHRDVKLIVIPVAADADDVAIVQADAPRGLLLESRPRLVTARVMNFGKTARERVKVAFEVNGATVETREIALPAGGAAPVRFRHRFDRLGDNPGCVRVEAADADPANNVFYFNARVQPRIRVAILNGRPSVQPRDDAAYFLRAALDMGEDSPFDVRTLPADAAEAAAEAARAGVIILADVSTAAPATVDALRQALRRGGGLLFLPGRSTDAAAFQRTFGDLAPCGLRRVLTPGDSGEHAETSLATVNYDYPAFETFKGVGRGDFRAVRFYKYWEVTGSQTAHVPARFEDERPAILEKKVDGGTVILAMTPGDPEWSDFPQRVLFLPYLHELVQHLGARAERRTAYTVGEVVELPKGARVLDEKGQSLGDPARVTETPGLWTVEPPAGGVAREGEPASFRIAVNRDFAEADPARIGPDEILAALHPSGENAAGEADAVKLGRFSRADISLAMILAFCVLAIVELAAGNRVVRH